MALNSNKANPSWREYQKALKKRDARQLRVYKLFKLSLLLALFGVLGFLTIRYYPLPVVKAPEEEKPDAGPPKTPVFDLSRADLAAVLKPGRFHQSSQPEFNLLTGNRSLQVRTTLDPSFQDYMISITRRAHAKSMAFVALDPSDGRILVMTGFDIDAPDRNPCVETLYPAASIFKIVAAAAAVEKLGFHDQTIFRFHGGKYTLYRSQLKKTHPRAVSITLADAFGESVNPVFGQLGANYLKKERLNQHADLFAFNRPIPFDMPIPTAEFTVSDDTFNLAEIASGFNRTTRITPLHGAVIASIVAHSGVLADPFLVEQVSDLNGRVMYAHQPDHRRIIGKRSAHILQKMMAATIRTGTCQKTFRNYTRDPVLSKLHIGGKTGSLCGGTCETRFDWFVGFARAKQGAEAVVVACVVKHDQFIGKRSMEYAKDAMRFYFRAPR